MLITKEDKKLKLEDIFMIENRPKDEVDKELLKWNVELPSETVQMRRKLETRRSAWDWALSASFRWSSPAQKNPSSPSQRVRSTKVPTGEAEGGAEKKEDSLSNLQPLIWTFLYASHPF